MKNYRELRDDLLHSLSPGDFERNIWVGVTAAFFFFVYFIVFFGAVFSNLNLVSLLIIAVVLGFISEFLSIATHDILHGSVFRSKFFSLCFVVPFSTLTLISPSYWRYWHNFHHSAVDRWTDEERPYEIGFETIGYPKLRKWLGPLELFIFKTFHLTKSQWNFILDKRYKSAQHLSLKKQTASQFAFIFSIKLVMFIFLPFKIWLLLELLPLLIQNFLSSVFLVTQHGQALSTPKAIKTFTVTMPRFLEIYSLNLGYHIEHHLLPHISSHQLPKVRSLLKEKYKDFPQSRYTMWEALKLIYGPK